MGKTLIHVDCVDQRLFVSSAPIIASGGRNEDEIEFNFCPLWDGFEKTAVFYRDKSAVYHAIVSENRCIIPHEVLADEGWIYFGVFGVKDDITRTSEIMKYHIIKGAITTGTNPSDPTPDIYSQYIKRINDLESRADQFSEEVNQLSEEISKLSTYVTPEMFGAVGDGVADDTAAIQAALDSSLPVYAACDYLISSSIVISKSITLRLDGNLVYTGTSSAVVVTTSFCSLYFNSITSKGNGVEFRPSGATANVADNCSNNILVCNRIYCNGTSGIALYLNCNSGLIQFSKFAINSIQGKWNTRLIDGVKIVATDENSRYCNGNIFDIHSISFCNNAIISNCVPRSCISNVFDDLHFEQNNVSLDLNNTAFSMSACYDEPTAGVVKINENVSAVINILGAMNDSHFDTSADITSLSTSWHFVGAVNDANGNRICDELYFTKYGIISPNMCTPTYKLTNLDGIMGCRHVGYIVPNKTYKVPAVKCSGACCPLSHFEFVFSAAELGSATFEFSDGITKTVTWNKYSGVVKVYPRMTNDDYYIFVE